MKKNWNKISVIGAGNLGTAIANGLTASGLFRPGDITLTRRRLRLLESFRRNGFQTTSNNLEAVASSGIILIAVEPPHLDSLLAEIGSSLSPEKHLLVSVIAGVDTGIIRKKIPEGVPVVRAAPNTAVAVRESMTCLCTSGDTVNQKEAIETAENIFQTVGQTMVIQESQMSAATALCASGIAFFLRAIRAASQGGTEIGFHATESNLLAAQAAKGAASLLLSNGNHPETEIDRVTTPGGCTISGLNEMEKHGFSSALIEGIVHAAEKAGGLYKEEEKEG